MADNDNQDGDMKMKLKLLYFNLRARGEVLRFLLIHSQLDWEDVLVPMNDWVDGQFDNDSIPPGRTGKKQLPVLSITSQAPLAIPDEYTTTTTTTTSAETTTLIAESIDIAKWIAKQCDSPLLGSTPELSAKAERIFSYSDVGESSQRLGYVNPLLNYLPIEEVKKQLPVFLDELPHHLSFLSTEIGDGPYVCGTELTYVDFMVFHYIDNLCTLLGEENILDKACPNPNLRNYYDKMYRLPAISKRMMDRPLSGSGEVGIEGSIIHSVKAPSRLDFIKDVMKEKLGIGGN
jgi:glutathione S-transferase